MILSPGNIWSGNKSLAALTNPTELAFRKGNLKQHYPLSFKNNFYEDAESAYQSLKLLYTPQNKMFLMFNILVEKLKSYPHLIEDINDSGGISFLEKCDHIVYGNSIWEGHGRDSQFIRCLIAAYKQV